MRRQPCPPPQEADTWPATHTYPRTQQGRGFLLCTAGQLAQTPCSCPLIKKPEAVLEPTFIVLLLRPGRQQSRCWVIYTYTHMYTHCPHLQQRQRQPCLKGQLKCSFCQFHRRRSHNQKEQNRSPVSHEFTAQNTGKGMRSVTFHAPSPHPASKLCPWQGLLRAREGWTGPPGSGHPPTH